MADRGYSLLKSSSQLAVNSTTSQGRKRLAFLILLTIGILALFIDRPEDGLNKLEQCVAPIPPIAKPPAPLNLWASLTIPETTSIQKWLEDPERNFNLTRVVDSALSDNVIFHIETYYPSKVEALAYLAGGDIPEKYARVTIHHGGDKVPVVRNYLVGPLPIGNDTAMKPLTDIYHESDIPYNARGFISPAESEGIRALITPELTDVMQDLFGDPNIASTLDAGASGPFSFDGKRRRTWLSWRKNLPGSFLHPVGFYLYVDISGTDPSLWKVLKTVYNSQIFYSMDDFLSAYRNGTLIRLPSHPDTEDYSWSTRKRVGEPRDLDHLPGPRSVSFAGLRFRVDRATQYISWMGWGMYLAFDRDMGLSLRDIRLKGERIIYEVSLPQEAIVQYAGNDPMQASTTWQDRYGFMGGGVRDMLPGYDCPLEAVYLPATTYSGMGSIVQEKAICVFEMDSGRPVTRHTGYMKGEFGAVKGYVLTVRSISTMGNYDYIFDYMFHIDGTMEVRVSASGYLQGGYWEPSQEEYGGRIGEMSMGNLHDHSRPRYRRPSNSLLETTTSQEAVHQPWFDPIPGEDDDEWGSVSSKPEDDSKLKYPVNFQGGYAINRWGRPRGYAILAGYNPIHNTVVGSRRLLNNANWARYNLAVSLRKDTEPSSSSIWNANLPGAPTVDFHRFFDGEDIVQRDLVAWVNVGMHHLPHAEDSPNTKTTIAMSSFLLTPLNYFDSDISLDSPNATPGDDWAYDDNGVKQDFTCIPQPAKATYDAEGILREPTTVEEMRDSADMYHRVKVEL
ncbi:amine oxidase catalytic domain-containing protein [Gymnopus androsaceus JB14]|uniref:Amine oxidase n=1 Tax=Gymnopus androsaceus JB14 TaxID=1447944 RepID=A0A6A4GN82_9AGAR|nr:amine oxidase catalytic domain-containing protein [Gymnopus androsaceus JB14]